MTPLLRRLTAAPLGAQARQPRGVPVGGQFATAARSEADVTLGAPATRWRPQGPPPRVPTPTLEEARGRAAARPVAAQEALTRLADAVLERAGVPSEVRLNGRLHRMLVAASEHVSSLPAGARRDRVLAALSDPALAEKAHALATMTPGRYDINAMHYLGEVGS